MPWFLPRSPHPPGEARPLTLGNVVTGMRTSFGQSPGNSQLEGASVFERGAALDASGFQGDEKAAAGNMEVRAAASTPAKRGGLMDGWGGYFTIFLRRSRA